MTDSTGSTGMSESRGSTISTQSISSLMSMAMSYPLKTGSALIKDRWISDLVSISRGAISTLNSMVLSPMTAVVFDIDETLIEADGQLMDPINILMSYSHMIGCHPILITNRVGTSDTMNFTKAQLNFLGVRHYEFILYRPAIGEESTNPWIYKTNARKRLADSGWTVVMSVGDMPWDIGQYGGIGITIPRLSFYTRQGYMETQASLDLTKTTRPPPDKPFLRVIEER